MAKILMPKATAVWLIDNTTLTFEQIAEFCELHPLEVKGIADGEVAENMRGADPVASGELTREEIEKGEKDKTYSLKMPPMKHANVPEPKKKGARFTPVSRRKDRPDAIAWFLRHHPEITDAQISRLIGTTKSTIESRALAPALECDQPQAGRSGDAGPVHADRARRSRLESRRQEIAGARREGCPALPVRRCARS